MKKCILLFAFALLTFQGHALAEGVVEVTWVKSEEFRDVKPTIQSRSRFREQTFNALEKYLEKLAEKLPEGQKLKMEVTDLDLAGQVWPGTFVGFNTSSDVRLIKQIDYPRINFTYKLVGADGVPVKQGEERLVDMNFQQRTSRMFRSENLRYEKVMLRDWFEDTLLKQE